MVDSLHQAFSDWNSQHAYIDNNGNYRLRGGFGHSSGKIAPWNKDVKKRFAKVSDFHNEAKKFKNDKIEKLVPKKVQVHRGGKVFEREQLVNPETAMMSHEFPARPQIMPYPGGWKILFGDKEWHFSKKKEAQEWLREYAVYDYPKEINKSLSERINSFVEKMEGK